MSTLPLPLGWCQRWTDRRHSWRRRGEGGFDGRHYDWALLEEPAARAFVQQHHYSGSFPAARLSLGMHDRGGALVGVAVLAVPVRAEVLTGPFPGLVPYRESIELARFVLLDRVPANGETWFLARVFAHLRTATEVRGVVAFSDPTPRTTADGRVVMPGHWGTIYQAKGAIFLGRGRARWITLLPDGAVLNDRARAKLLAGERGWRYVRDRLVALGATPPLSVAVPDRGWLSAALDEVGARRVRHGGNLRYGFALHRGVRLGMTSGPYPKRDGA